MKFDFADKKLRLLFTSLEGADDYPESVVESFFEVVQVIKNAKDERDLYALKSLRYEKLQGRRGQRGERSLRLNNQWRLIVKPERATDGKIVWVLSISNHYS